MPVDAITENTTVQNATVDNQYTGVIDLNLDSLNNTTTNPDAGFLSILNGTDLRVRNQLMRFDGLSNISSGVTVNSATLYIRSVFTNAGTVDVDLRRVIQSFPIVSPDLPSWDNYNQNTASAWDTAGCEGDGTDRVATPESTTSISSAGGTWFALDLTSLVEDWINGTVANEGCLLSTDDVAGTIRSLTSSEGTDGQRPELIVDWTAAGGSDLIAQIRAKQRFLFSRIHGRVN